MESIRAKDVQILTNRLKEVESVHAKDVQHLTNRLKEVESMRAKDVEIFTKRLAEAESMRAEDVKILTTRRKEVESMRAKDVEIFTKRLAEVESTCAKDVRILTNRITEMENLCVNDSQTLPNRREEMLNLREMENPTNHVDELQYMRTGNVQSLAIPTDVDFMTNHMQEEKPFLSKDIKDLAKTLTTSAQKNRSKNMQPVQKDAQDMKYPYQTPDKRSSPLMSSRVASVTDWVAFHAILHAPMSDPSWGHIIPFSEIKTNIGNNEYHPTTGVFTCKKAGIYVFSWSIRVNQADHGLETELALNGATVGYNTAGGGDGNTWGYGSATVTLYLQVGDEVWVKAGGRIDGITISPISMFTAFLVHAD
ncbi:uncharacterized protein LOC117345299 [Pecten maximus]|uniref:uncharacterized protein LOC117345299 n=1 Tax=Pecten maximus TaxID=6579 RepID=UPI001458F382|nr:uncharacterized protein LOC117345299 [Pecten maximus]